MRIYLYFCTKLLCFTNKLFNYEDKNYFFVALRRLARRL